MTCIGTVTRIIKVALLQHQQLAVLPDVLFLILLKIAAALSNIYLIESLAISGQLLLSVLTLLTAAL